MTNDTILQNIRVLMATMYCWILPKCKIMNSFYHIAAISLILQNIQIYLISEMGVGIS